MKYIVYREVCRCGCGQETPFDKWGRRMSYVKGHFAAVMERNRVKGKTNSGQYARQKQRNSVRSEMLDCLRQNPLLTREQILKRFEDRGFKREGLSRILRDGVEFDSWVNGWDLKMPPKTIKKAPPQYERQEIPYEFETEIPLLTRNHYKFSSMDAELMDEDGCATCVTLHDKLPSHEYFDWEKVRPWD